VAPELLPASITDAVRHELIAGGGHVVVDPGGVVAVPWHPPPGVHELRLP
jgi:hypothetical protein